MEEGKKEKKQNKKLCEQDGKIKNKSEKLEKGKKGMKEGTEEEERVKCEEDKEVERDYKSSRRK